MSDREWITDRLPTAADADEDGDVTVQNRPKAEPSAGSYFNWSMVRPGMAWTHTDIWEAPPKPALAVGQRWRRRDGGVVTIDRYDRNHAHGETHPFWAGGLSYTADGVFNQNGVTSSDHDLVELIQDAPEEIQSPAAEIPEPIRTGAAPFFVLVIGDDSGGKVDGTPIVWETQIPAGSSLQAVLQQRQRVGSRYGTTYVAECRIIPELTSEVTREVPF